MTDTVRVRYDGGSDLPTEITVDGVRWVAERPAGSGEPHPTKTERVFLDPDDAAPYRDREGFTVGEASEPDSEVSPSSQDEEWPTFPDDTPVPETGDGTPCQSCLDRGEPCHHHA